MSAPYPPVPRSIRQRPSQDSCEFSGRSFSAGVLSPFLLFRRGYFLVRLCRVGVLSERTKQIHFTTDPLQDKIHPVQQVKEACSLDAWLLPRYRGGSLVLHQQSSACPAHQKQGTTNAQVQSAMCQHSIGLLHSL